MLLVADSSMHVQVQEGAADQAAAALGHLKAALAGTQAKRGACSIQAMMATEHLTAGNAVAARHNPDVPWQAWPRGSGSGPKSGKKSKKAKKKCLAPCSAGCTWLQIKTCGCFTLSLKNSWACGSQQVPMD